MALIPVNETEANLRRAFACEMLASRRYLACAAISEAEGHRQAATVFRYIAARRAGHAEEHLKMLDSLEDARTGRSNGATRDHLRAAIKSKHEGSALYAGMARTARGEGFNEIADWFEMLAKAGNAHGRRLQHVLESLEERGFGSYAPCAAASGSLPEA